MPISLQISFGKFGKISSPDFQWHQNHQIWTTFGPQNQNSYIPNFAVLGSSGKWSSRLNAILNISSENDVTTNNTISTENTTFSEVREKIVNSTNTTNNTQEVKSAKIAQQSNTTNDLEAEAKSSKSENLKNAEKEIIIIKNNISGTIENFNKSITTTANNSDIDHKKSTNISSNTNNISANITSDLTKSSAEEKSLQKNLISEDFSRNASHEIVTELLHENLNNNKNQPNLQILPPKQRNLLQSPKLPKSQKKDEPPTKVPPKNKNQHTILSKKAVVDDIYPPRLVKSGSRAGKAELQEFSIFKNN